MTIAQLDPADSVAMGRWYDLAAAVTRHDRPDFPAPSRREHAARFEHPWPASAEEVLLARDGDRVVGAASYLLPQAENLSTAYLQLIVHPRHRRRGIGTRLLAEVYAAARRHDRSLVEVETVRSLPGGVARDEAGYRWLTDRAHRPGLTSIRYRCRVGDQPGGALADGYSLVRWRDAVPAEIIGDIAALQSRLTADAPTGDLTAEQEPHDADRVRAQEATQLGRGHHWYSTAARHDATGRIVARTKLSFEADDDTHARQRVTIVEPDHRGRRLGLAVKAANHAYARGHEPALRVIDSWNAEENTHMRAGQRGARLPAGGPLAGLPTAGAGQVTPAPGSGSAQRTSIQGQGRRRPASRGASENVTAAGSLVAVSLCGPSREPGVPIQSWALARRPGAGSTRSRTTSAPGTVMSAHANESAQWGGVRWSL
jgi:GNAT superfamily N-acetyltransferase